MVDGWDLPVSVEGVVMCLFCVAAMRATVDLLTEAKYTEELAKKPEKGPELVSFVWGGIETSGLVGVVPIVSLKCCPAV